MQQSPTFLAPGIDFIEGNFPQVVVGWWFWFHLPLTYCAAQFLTGYILVAVHSPGDWGIPALMFEPSVVLYPMLL